MLSVVKTCGREVVRHFFKKCFVLAYKNTYVFVCI